MIRDSIRVSDVPVDSAGGWIRPIVALLVVAAAGLSPVVAGEPEGPSSGRPPNVVFILADDLGWAELGSYGNRFNETPRLDAMAREGLRFTHAYAAAPVCSPYRAALMSGQFPARVGITDYLRPDDPKHLPTEHVTLAEMFRRAGYATGMLGKWHLTGYAHHGALEVPPSEHGFDEAIVSEKRGIGGGSYYHPYHFNPDVKPRLPNEYLVDRLNLEAVEFIDRHRDRPFFLYVSHYAVHTALVGKPELVAKYEAKPKSGKGPRAKKNNPHLAAQLESIDEGVGMILDKLAELGLDRQTLVIFTSDNGGEDRVTSNAPLRAGKSTLYEGGIREPLVVRWPGVVPPGTVSHEPVCCIDFYPTLLDVARGARDPGQKLDGVSILPLLEKPKATLARDTLYWHYPLEKPHFLGGRSAGAVRRGDWKLIELFDTAEKELYNLADDVGETKNLADALPDVAADLHAKLDAWRDDVGAVVPAPTPRTKLTIAGRERLFDVHGTEPVPAAPSTARRFDGVDDYLDLPRSQAPRVKGKAIEVRARIAAEGPDGVILAHGGDRHGYALFLQDGKPGFCTCVDWKRTTLLGRDALPHGPVDLTARIGGDGTLTLEVTGRTVAEGKSPGPLVAEPGDSLQIGADMVKPVGPYRAANHFAGCIERVSVRVGE